MTPKLLTLALVLGLVVLLLGMAIDTRQERILQEQITLKQFEVER